LFPSVFPLPLYILSLYLFVLVLALSVRADHLEQSCFLCHKQLPSFHLTETRKVGKILNWKLVLQIALPALSSRSVLRLSPLFPFSVD
jgi:hypothetical protein